MTGLSPPNGVWEGGEEREEVEEEGEEDPNLSNERQGLFFFRNELK